MQRRIANTSIAPAAARSMGPAGTIQAARRYLSRLDLSDFSSRHESQFAERLNHYTKGLRRRLPEGGRHWGSSRKFLNIFLRGVVYNRYLCHEFALTQIETWLEVPLDSHVAKGLRHELGGECLPGWKSVISLNHYQNRQFQDFASEVANRYGTSRVHLDLRYWRRPD